jgi:hypothetical protein
LNDGASGGGGRYGRTERQRFCVEKSSQKIGPRILADSAKERHFSTRTRGCYRLIKAFAARKFVIGIGKNCFPGFWEALPSNEKVNVGATNHNKGHGDHFLYGVTMFPT